MTKIKKPTGKIYRAYNKVTGLSYIGLTIKSLEARKNKHYYTARCENSKNYKFQNALNKYFTEDWEWIILENNITEDKLSEFEIMYISKFDSYYNGYNSTLGGEGGKTAKKQKLFHPNHGWQEMTVKEFSNKYNICIPNINLVIRGIYKQAKGWRLTEEIKEKTKKLKEKKPRLIREYKQKTHTIIFEGREITDTLRGFKDKYNISRDAIYYAKGKKNRIASVDYYIKYIK